MPVGDDRPKLTHEDGLELMNIVDTLLDFIQAQQGGSLTPRHIQDRTKARLYLSDLRVRLSPFQLQEKKDVRPLRQSRDKGDGTT